MARVVLLRGHNVNEWDLRPFEALAPEHDVSVLVTGSNLHRIDGLRLRQVPVATPRDRLPAGRGAGAAAYALGERYLGLKARLAGAEIVHAAEIGTWFTAQAAELRDALGFKLVVTVWETLPWLSTYRWPRERAYRKAVLPKVDLCLAATQRAADTLLLEGVPASKIEVAPPGIALDRFAAAATGSDPRPAAAGSDPTSPRGGSDPTSPRGGSDPPPVLSAGRLVWEKGHQDVLRAVAALRRGLVGDPRPGLRLLVVGDGPEGKRLRAHAEELGIADAVEFRATVPYDEMPSLYASAACLVLASIPVKGWEEQFGMVLVEAMAAGTPVVASDSGAMPEVLDGAGRLVRPNDWRALAGALADPPPPAGPAALARFSVDAAAARYRAAYGRVLAGTRP
jgi:glycosyltransferase involved in cell wall biosynthesis